MADPFFDIRESFPRFHRTEGEAGIYLDTAATSLCPFPVLETLQEYYSSYRANIHRGAYRDAVKAEGAFEASREKLASFVGAQSSSEIIFTAGCTDSLNLLASALFPYDAPPGGSICLSVLEHHSNMLPWMDACRRLGMQLKSIPLDSSTALSRDAVSEVISPDCRLVAVTALSNVSGEAPDLEPIIRRAREVGAYVVVDGAQAAARLPLSVRKLDIDFYTFSGHKIYGPNGIGVLYGKQQLLERLSPPRSGGGMLMDLADNSYTARDLPQRLEAGTPNIAGAIGLGAAVDFIEEIGREAIEQHDAELTSYCNEALEDLAGLETVHPIAPRLRGCVSFYSKTIHPHDLSTILDGDGIAVRGGVHCAQAFHSAIGVPGTVRASFGVYTSRDDIDRLRHSLEKALTFFA